MLPHIELLADVDVLALSPLLRGMVLAVSYAETEGGIGLTAAGAMNRKFVHWAAVHFDWPGYTSEDLYSINKVLNEADMRRFWSSATCSSIYGFFGGEKTYCYQPDAVGNLLQGRKSSLI